MVLKVQIIFNFKEIQSTGRNAVFYFIQVLQIVGTTKVRHLIVYPLHMFVTPINNNILSKRGTMVLIVSLVASSALYFMTL